MNQFEKYNNYGFPSLYSAKAFRQAHTLSSLLLPLFPSLLLPPLTATTYIDRQGFALSMPVHCKSWSRTIHRTQMYQFLPL